jgi:LysM repeat protein
MQLALLIVVDSALGWTCGNIHTTVAGESCYSIWTDAHITESQFLAMNSKLVCNPLRVGQKVCTAPSCTRFYTVKSGDYCYKIAQEQGISEGLLTYLNPGMTCSALVPDQRLCVGDPEATVSSVQPTATTSA